MPVETMPGAFHSLSESKIAPMLVTGSYIGILQKIMDEYLEAGRLSIVRFAPYLAPEEGLQAVYQYAEAYQQPITNQTAQQINELCMADPFFISCIIQSGFPGKDLTTTETDTRRLNIIDVRERFAFQRADGKVEEIDLLAQTTEGVMIMIEVRKRQEKTGLKAVTDLRDNAVVYAQQHNVTVFPAFLSLGGFTEEATAFCREQGIGLAEAIAYADF